MVWLRFVTLVFNFWSVFDCQRSCSSHVINAEIFTGTETLNFCLQETAAMNFQKTEMPF